MVLFALSLAVMLPLAMGGQIMYQQQQQPMMAYQQQQQQQPMMAYPQQQQWGNWNVQMNGVMMPTDQQQQQTQESNTKWWNMKSQEEYEAYLKWCAERQAAIQQQEESQQLLKELQERAEAQERAHEREKAQKEMEMKRESMQNQWKMWKAQLEMGEEFDGVLEHFMEMKGMYWFKLTTEFLKFCRCSDYASHLQRYLMYGSESYSPTVGEVFMLDGMDGIDTTNVDAVAQRLASMSQSDQVKQFFGGAISTMCGSVKSYVDQVISWEAQYNFMGH